MSLGDLLHLALGRLGTGKLRTALTALGVIIGVASVVALVSVAQGATKGISDRLQSLGTNLVTEPALILADEPTGNLDSHSGAEVLSIFKDLHALGRTIVLITHDIEVATAADRGVHIRDGQLQEAVLG